MARGVKAGGETWDYKGGREVIIMNCKCGWCLTNECKNCKHEVAYYEKLWICPCECNKDWVPQDVGAYEIKRQERKQTEEIEDDLPDVRIPTDTGRDTGAKKPRGKLRQDSSNDATTGESTVGEGDGGNDSETEEE